jgi:dihydroorotate dehydrogenase (fumarate)
MSSHLRDMRPLVDLTRRRALGPTEPRESERDVEARHADFVQAVCETVALPVSVKLTPFFSSFGHFAGTLVARGASGLVLFNRVTAPDIDLTRMHLTGRLMLSEADEMRAPLLWTALLSGRTEASLAAYRMRPAS